MAPRQILIVPALAALATAINLSDYVPSCGPPCIIDAVTDHTTCDVGDNSCICSDAYTVKRNGESCLRDDCDETDYGSVMRGYEQFCKDVSSSPTSSGSSSSSSSSSGSSSASAGEITSLGAPMTHPAVETTSLGAPVTAPAEGTATASASSGEPTTSGASGEPAATGSASSSGSNGSSASSSSSSSSSSGTAATATSSSGSSSSGSASAVPSDGAGARADVGLATGLGGLLLALGLAL